MTIIISIHRDKDEIKFVWLVWLMVTKVRWSNERPNIEDEDVCETTSTMEDDAKLVEEKNDHKLRRARKKIIFRSKTKSLVKINKKK